MVDHDHQIDQSLEEGDPGHDEKQMLAVYSQKVWANLAWGCTRNRE